jgi:hypothetical protein
MYLLTPWNRSPCGEANRFSGSQEIACILWNLKVHYHCHKCPPPVLSWTRSFQSLPSIPSPEDPCLYYPPIYAWIMLVISLPQVSTPKHCLHICCHDACYRNRPSHYILFNHLNNIGWGVQIIWILIMQFSPIPCYLVPLKRLWIILKGCAIYWVNKNVLMFISRYGKYCIICGQHCAISFQFLSKGRAVNIFASE